MNVNQPDIIKARAQYAPFWEVHGHMTSLLGFVTEQGDCFVASNTACHASMASAESVMKGGYDTMSPEDGPDSYDDYEEDEEEDYEEEA